MSDSELTCLYNNANMFHYIFENRIMDLEQIRQALRQYNQEHLVEFWSTLNEEEQTKLYKDVKEYVLLCLIRIGAF